MTYTIKIPTQTQDILEGRSFEVPDLNGVEKALRKCQNAGYEAIFMPQLIDARIAASENDYVLSKWFTTPSVKVTGRGKISDRSKKGGTPFVVYAHLSNYFSNPDNIAKSVEQGLQVGAGNYPQKEFQRLLDLKDDENVFVVDYQELKRSPSDLIAVSKAIKHPQTIPFLGGEERSENYLEEHKEIFGDRIGIWHYDDLDVQPHGRLLVLGNIYGDLYGYDSLYDGGRFVGVKSVPQASAEKIKVKLSHLL